MYRNIWKDIVLLNLKSFENIGIDFYFNIFVFAFAACICVGAVLFELNRGSISLTVKQLLRHNAFEPSSAKTLAELGILNKKLIRYSLTRKSRLSKLVTRVGAPEISYEEYIKLTPEKKRELEKFDIGTAKFYINEENRDRTKNIYRTYGFSLPRVILFCVFVLIFSLLIAIFSYEIFCVINSLLGKM